MLSCMQMRFLPILLAISSLCVAQQIPTQIEKEHALSMEKNPPDVVFTVAVGQPKLALSKELQLQLLFSSKRPRTYSAELAPGGNTAAIDDFVYLGPGMDAPVHSKDSIIPTGVVCCGSRRRYVRQTAIAGNSFLHASMMTRLRIPDPFADHSRGPEATPPAPGDYWLFVETRRVMRGWPKGADDIYFKTSDVVVTSSNIVRITVLPDGNLRFARSSP